MKEEEEDTAYRFVADAAFTIIDEKHLELPFLLIGVFFGQACCRNGSRESEV